MCVVCRRGDGEGRVIGLWQGNLVCDGLEVVVELVE